MKYALDRETNLPSLYVIERHVPPEEMVRYFGHDDAGAPFWMRFDKPLNVFSHRSSASAFRRFRLAGIAYDCKVTRFTVH